MAKGSGTTGTSFTKIMTSYPKDSSSFTPKGGESMKEGKMGGSVKNLSHSLGTSVNLKATGGK